MVRKIGIIGVPMDWGQEKSGVAMGPQALRKAGLLAKLESIGWQVTDYGDVQVPERITDPEMKTEAAATQKLQAVIHSCEQAAELGRKSIEKGDFPIFIGGDHSMSIGTVAAITTNQAAESVGMVWIDAHADFNNFESSPSKNIHGMPVSVLVGDGHSELVDIGYNGPKLLEKNIVQIGIRDLDPLEEIRVNESQMQVYMMDEVRSQGMAEIAKKTLADLDSVDKIHVSLDMDGLDPTEAPGVWTPVSGGMTFNEVKLLLASLAASGKVVSLDIVETNPKLDIDDKTSALAVELAAVLMAAKIL